MALEEYLGNWEEWKIWIKRHDRAGTRASKCVHMWRVFFRANGDLVMRFGAENGFAFCFLNKKLRIFPKEKRKKKKSKAEWEEKGETRSLVDLEGDGPPPNRGPQTWHRPVQDSAHCSLKSSRSTHGVTDKSQHPSCPHSLTAWWLVRPERPF